jgi:hypothetical protein
MSLPRYLSLVALLLGLTAPVSAYDAERALANFADDYAQCTAYYLTSAAGAERSGHPDATAQFKEAALRTLTEAIRLSTAEVAAARVELDVLRMATEMQGNFSNFAILIKRYGLLCKGILEEPAARLQYWLDR